MSIAYIFCEAQGGSRWQRLRHECDAAERRASYSGLEALVELPKRLELPSPYEVVEKSGKRYALAVEVRAWLDSEAK